MSRFDEISPLWQNFKSFWAICLMVYLVFGNFVYPLWHFYTTGQIVIVVVGQIWLSGHTDDDVDAAAVCRCQIKISSTNRSKNCYRTANVRNNLLPSFVLRNILCWQKNVLTQYYDDDDDDDFKSDFYYVRVTIEMRGIFDSKVYFQQRINYLTTSLNSQFVLLIEINWTWSTSGLN